MMKKIWFPLFIILMFVSSIIPVMGLQTFEGVFDSGGFGREAQTSPSLDFLKDRCTAGANIDNCGSFYCIDDAAGLCSDSFSTCSSIVFTCSGNGDDDDGQICTDSDGGNEPLVPGKVIADGITYKDTNFLTI